MSSFQPKKSFYFAKGSGRDTYISTNSGGFYKTNITENFDPSTLLKKIFKKFIVNYEYIPERKGHFPNIQAKPVHYPPDGSGRDCYIIVNQGGLFQSTPISPQFIKTLRGYNKMRNLKYNGEIDYFERCQKILPFKEALKIEERNKLQRRLLTRLTDDEFYKRHKTVDQIGNSKSQPKLFNLPSLKLARTD